MTDTGRARRWVGLALLPVLIVAIAAWAAYRTSPVQPTRYRATAIIVAPSTVGESAAALNLFVADWSEQVKADSVVEHVIEQVSGLEERTYRRNIEASRRGSTSSIEVSFIHSDSSVAEQTIEALAQRLLDDASRTELERTQFLLERATERLDRAEEALATFFASESVFDPDFEYHSVLDEVADLNRQITTGQALSYGQTYLDELVARRDELEATLPRLGQAMIAFRALTTELENAQEAWEQANHDSDLADFEYRVTNAPDKLVIGRALSQFTDATPRLQRAALAGAVGLLLSLVTVLPLSMRLFGRHRKETDSTAPETIDLATLGDATDRSSTKASARTEMGRHAQSRVVPTGDG